MIAAENGRGGGDGGQEVQPPGSGPGQRRSVTPRSFLQVSGGANLVLKMESDEHHTSRQGALHVRSDGLREQLRAARRPAGARAPSSAARPGVLPAVTSRSHHSRGSDLLPVMCPLPRGPESPSEMSLEALGKGHREQEEKKEKQAGQGRGGGSGDEATRGP